MSDKIHFGEVEEAIQTISGFLERLGGLYRSHLDFDDDPYYDDDRESLAILCISENRDTKILHQKIGVGWKKGSDVLPTLMKIYSDREKYAKECAKDKVAYLISGLKDYERKALLELLLE